MAGIGAPFEATAGPAWNTYVERAETRTRSVAKVEAAGGTVVAAPFDIGDGGADGRVRRPRGRARSASGRPGSMAGAQLVNAPGSWNWSDLETRDIEAAKAFYGAVFGWEFGEVDLGQGPNAMIRVPGLRRATSTTLTPGTLEQPQVDGGAPARLLGRRRLDAANRPRERRRRAGSSRSPSPTPTKTAARAKELGGTVLAEPFDVPYVRMAVVARSGRRDVRDRAVRAAGGLERFAEPPGVGAAAEAAADRGR